MFAAKIKGLSQNVKIKEIKSHFKPLRLKNILITKNGSGILYFRNEKDLTLGLKKSGRFQNKTVKLTKLQDVASTDKNLENSEKRSWPTRSDSELESAILETGRLFVRNLSYTCTEKELEKLFSAYGSLSDIHVAFDKWNQTSKGYAFVTYIFPTDAVKAFKSLDKTKFLDRLLHIIPAEEPIEDRKAGIGASPASPEAKMKKKNKSTSNPDDTTDSHLFRTSFQDSRFGELKSLAGTGHNWNTLFIRPDAVATYLSAKFGLPLEDILNPSSHGSVAVRLAHGETQLVNEMRDFLQSNGVRLEAFDQESVDTQSSLTSSSKEIICEKTGRRNRLEATAVGTVRQMSGTAFLIKNLPIGTTEAELRELLKRYSKQENQKQQDECGRKSHSGLRRVLIPSLGITAIVEYAHSQQAKLMYKALAYEPYKDSVLYVQWLPEGALLPPTSNECQSSSELSEQRRKSSKRSSGEGAYNKDSQDDFNLLTELPSDADSSMQPKKRRKKESSLQQLDDYVGDDDDNPNTVILQSDNQLVETKPQKKIRKHKNKSERIRAAEQAMTLTTNTTTVEDKENESSSPDLDLMSVDDQKAETKSQKHKTATIKAVTMTQSKPPNRILMVRNVPFQATLKELQELFEPIGGLMSVRLPKKLTGGHRGFAFVEFTSIEQSKAALETLGLATHLLGRRLRIEFADQQ